MLDTTPLPEPASNGEDPKKPPIRWPHVIFWNALVQVGIIALASLAFVVDKPELQWQTFGLVWFLGTVAHLGFTFDSLTKVYRRKT